MRSEFPQRSLLLLAALIGSAATTLTNSAEAAPWPIFGAAPNVQADPIGGLPLYFLEDGYLLDSGIGK